MGKEVVHFEELKDLTILVQKLETFRVVKPLFKGFSRPKHDYIVEHVVFSLTQIKEGFDPNSYKLMAKVRYNR